MSEKKLIEIDEHKIEKYQEEAYKLITEKTISVTQSDEDRNSGYRTTVAGASASSQKKVKLMQAIKSISSNQLLSDTEHHIVTSINRALQISGAVFEMFMKSSGMDVLYSDNRAGKLTTDNKSKLGDLQRTSSAIVLWVVANFLQREFAEQAQNTSVAIEHIDSIRFDNPSLVNAQFIYELERNIKQFANDEKALLSVVYQVSEQALSKIELLADSLSYTNYFTDYNYQVEKDQFEINGFNRASQVRTQELVMNFKRPDEVIGNAIAKYQASRIAKMIMCYDFERKMNPFAELGGFIYTFMGDGNPGTGKTTLIQMMAGLMNDYCKNAGVPFHYENFSVDNIDSYQGKSAQHAKQFIRNVSNPNVIGFGTIDDIDQVAGKRGDSKASEGQLGVTATLMESFAGANTKILGNATFGMFSNYPDQVDDALRQRASARFLIDGPQTPEDFIDIAALFAGKNHEIPVGNIELFATQQIQKAVSESYEKHNLPQTDALKAVYELTLSEEGALDTIAAIGRYLHNIKEADDRFTGRAVANIFNSATARTMDFDMPDEWFENPETFLLLPYDEKKGMIQELQTPMTASILIQEINRYADSEFRYGNKTEESEVKRRVDEISYQTKAVEQYKRQQG